MRLEDYDYTLPKGLIAQFPASPRESARLLVYERATKKIEHRSVADITEILTAGDVMVVNNTRVIPARLAATAPDLRSFEILLLRPTPKPLVWRCLVKPGKKVRPNLEVTLIDGTRAKLERVGEEFFIHFPPQTPTFFEWLSQVGTPPIPPYLSRKAEASDWANYQTIFAQEPGAVAAPTAGLHFTPEVISRIKQAGVTIVGVTLHVGYGTFAPLSEEGLKANELHSESYFVPPTTLEACSQARAAGRRVLCVGTTSLRALESAAVGEATGDTRLFIKPGFQFQYANALLTNFHLPKTSLLVLVSSFMGREAALDCYREAIRQEYRFYSYGDAMLVY